MKMRVENFSDDKFLCEARTFFSLYDCAGRGEKNCNCDNLNFYENPSLESTPKTKSGRSLHRLILFLVVLVAI